MCFLICAFIVVVNFGVVVGVVNCTWNKVPLNFDYFVNLI
jgi:hypothetical protein